MLAYVVERDLRGDLGRDIVFHASKAHPTLEVRRMDWSLALNSILRDTPNRPLPAVLMVPTHNQKPDW